MDTKYGQVRFMQHSNNSIDKSMFPSLLTVAWKYAEWN